MKKRNSRNLNWEKAFFRIHAEEVKAWGKDFQVFIGHEVLVTRKGKAKAKKRRKAI